MAKGSRASDRASSGGGTGGSDLNLVLSVNTSQATKGIQKATKAIALELGKTRKEVSKTGKLFQTTFSRTIPDAYRKATNAANNFAKNNRKQIRIVRLQFKALKTEAMALGSALTTVYTGITGLLVGRQIQQSFRAAATKELAAARTGEVSELFGADTAEIQKGILDLRREGLFTYGALAYSARQLASMNLEVEGSIEDLLRAFRNIAVVEGFYDDINFSITSFIKGIQTGTAELLENLSPRIRTMIVDMGGFAKIQQDVNLRNQLLNNILRDGKVQQESYNRVAATSEIRLKKLQTRYTELLETFGEGLLPVFNDFADLMDNVVRNLTTFFSSLDDSEKRAAALTATFSALVLLLAGPFLSALQLITAAFRTGITVINLYARALQTLYSIMVAVMAIKAPIAAVITALIGIAGALGAFFGIKGVMDSVTESLSDTSSAAEDAYDKYNALSNEIETLNNEYMTLQKSIAASSDAMDKVNHEKYQAEVLRSAQIVETLNQKQSELIGISRKLAAEGAGISLARATKKARDLGFSPNTQLTSRSLMEYMGTLTGASPELVEKQAERARIRRQSARVKEYEKAFVMDPVNKEYIRKEKQRISKDLKRVNDELKELQKRSRKSTNRQLLELGNVMEDLLKFEEYYSTFTQTAGGTLTQTQGGRFTSKALKARGASGLPGFRVGADAGPGANAFKQELASLQGVYFDQLERLSQFIINKNIDIQDAVAEFNKELNEYQSRGLTALEAKRRKEFAASMRESLVEVNKAEKQFDKLVKLIERIAATKALEQINSALDSFAGNIKSIQDAIKSLNSDTLGSFVALAKGISGAVSDIGKAAFESGLISSAGAAGFGAAAAGIGFVGSALGVFDVLFGGLFDNSEEQLKEMERQRALQEAQSNYLKTLVDLEIDRQKSEREGLDREVDRLESIAERDKAMLEGQFTGEELQKKQLEIDQRLQEDIKNLLVTRLGSESLSPVKDLMAADPFAGVAGKVGGTPVPSMTKRQRISQAIMDREEIERIMREYQAERGVLVASRAGDAALSELASRTIDRMTPLLSPALQEQYRAARGSFSTMQLLGTPGIALNKFFEDFAATNEVDTGILTETLDIMNRLYDLETEGIETNNDLLGVIADNTKAVDLQQAQERGFSFIDISKGGLQQAGLFRGTRMSSLISDITTPTTLGNLVAVTEAKTTQQKMLDTLNDQLSELRIHTALLAKLTNSDPTRQVNDGLTTLSSALKVG